jgi:hypothetical protein
MPQIIKNECPCIGCKHFTISNVSYEYWCKKKEQTVIQHRGNALHRAGQWLIPCGRDMCGYEEGD